MKLIVHVEAEIFDWSEEKSSNNHAFLKQKKREKKKHNYRISFLKKKWDQPDTTGKGGTTTQGNTVRNLYKNVAVAVDFLSDKHWKTVFERYAKHLAIILRIISSSE